MRDARNRMSNSVHKPAVNLQMIQSICEQLNCVSTSEKRLVMSYTHHANTSFFLVRRTKNLFFLFSFSHPFVPSLVFFLSVSLPVYLIWSVSRCMFCRRSWRFSSCETISRLSILIRSHPTTPSMSEVIMNFLAAVHIRNARARGSDTDSHHDKTLPSLLHTSLLISPSISLPLTVHQEVQCNHSHRYVY